MRFFATSLFLLAGVLAARADAILGGTGVFKHETGNTYLVYLDWDYVQNTENDKSPSIILYDATSIDVPNMGSKAAESAVVDGRSLKRVTAPNGCVALIWDDREANYLVELIKISACNEYKHFAGRYSTAWLPPE